MSCWSYNSYVKLTTGSLHRLVLSCFPNPHTQDRVSGTCAGYGFVSYEDKQGAVNALLALNGRDYMGQQLKVNWSFPTGPKDEQKPAYQIFAGDLAPEVNDAVLYNAFANFGSAV